jgi:hypothetical protein
MNFWPKKNNNNIIILFLYQSSTYGICSPKNELIYVCLTKHKDGASSSSSTPNDVIMVVVPSEIFIYLFMPRFKMRDSFLCKYGLCTPI